jgi:PPOX class probable F420-dependent enzyme
MPPTPVPPDVDAFLRRPNPAVVASVRPDGSPHTAATWYEWDGERALLNMDASRLRLRFLRRDGRVALTCLDVDNWYRQVTLLGEVAEMRPDEGLADIDRLSLRYVGRQYHNRVRPRVTALVRADAWYGWDPHRAALWHAAQGG